VGNHGTPPIDEADVAFEGEGRIDHVAVEADDALLAGGKDIVADKVKLLHLQRREYAYHKRVPLQSGDGRRIDVEFISSVYPVNHRHVIQFNMRDITDQVSAELQRQELSDRLHHYIETSPAITYSFRIENGRTVWQWVSENVSRILGYSPAEALEPDWWLSRVHPEDRMQVISGIAELISKNALTREYRFTTKDRRSIWLRDEMRLLHTSADADDEVVGTLTDITDRKRSEAETSLKSAALEAAGNAIVITDRDGTIEWVNIAFTTLSGYAKEEAIGKNPRDLLKSGEQDPEMYRQLWDTIASGKSWQSELVNKKKSGELYDEEMLITPVMGESGRIAHFVAVKSDITERNRARKLLEASVCEKEVLLREVHHRVKNNMQIITSLLDLSEEGLQDAASSRIISELHRRIAAMAIVHEQFYEAQDLSRIDFSVYLGKLASYILEETGASPGNPEIRYVLVPLFLNLDMAIPAGFIVSELVSNAVKFSTARPDGKGIICISLHVRNGTEVELEIRDNGPGFPEGLNAASATTLGLRLIQILTEQLKGTVSIRNDEGAVTTLRFIAP